MKVVILIISFGLIWHQAFGANILVVFPHIYYSHFKQTSKLVTELRAEGHNITFVSPYSLDESYENIVDISIEGIIEPVQEVTNDFYKNQNRWDSYWSKLQYVNKIGYEYSKQVLSNPNVTQLIRSNSTFDLVIVEDVSADGLAILSHIFQCHLIILLSEPVSIFYDNYISDNIIWKQFNELRNGHHYIIKELFREWIIFPKQNELIKSIIPSAPDLRRVLYHTNLVLMPSYLTLTSLTPKYSNVQQIGGFHLGYSRRISPHTEMFLNSSKHGVIVVSNNFPSNVKDQLKTFSFIHKEIFQNILFTSDASDVLGHPKVNLFIGDGDVYDTGLAILNQVPVLSILNNQWYQHFLIHGLAEKGMAVQVPAQDLESDKFIETVYDMLVNNHRWKITARVAEQIVHPIAKSPMEEAMIWIEYVLNFNGAYHLIPWYLQWSLKIHLITTIIVISLVDITLLFVFYWIIKHFSKLVMYCGKKIEKGFKALSKWRRKATVSYIKL